MITHTQPWLSVVIPVHNGERWLAETLDSVVSQGDPDIECLVIDSSPGDGTLTIVRAYEDSLGIRIFKRTDLDNWRLKTNFGFAEAVAPFVSMLHQDDYWMPGRAAALRAWIGAAPQAIMHLHPSFIVDGQSRRIGRWSCPLPAEQLLSADLLLPKLLVQNFISVPAPIISRDAFLEVGGIEEPLWYTGDWDLYLKLARRGAVVYHDAPLTSFRIHSNSLTVTGSQNVEDFRAQMQLVMQRHIGFLPEPGRSKATRQARASVDVNSGLAAASKGSTVELVRALAAMLSLGPIGTFEYLRDSRLWERVAPRLRARFSGGL